MNAAELDEKLIVRLADQDADAFHDLYRLTSGAVYGFALSILKNKHDAEDVMHDTFIRVYHGAVSYIPRGKPLSWILTIVRNLSYNKLKSGSMCEDITQYEDLACMDGSEQTVDKIVLETAMKILSFEERQIVILHALTGMKHREIGELLEMPTGTVLSKYNRALSKVRAQMEAEGWEGGEAK